MSKDVDRNQVLKTIRVRSALKNDGSWIHRSKDDKKKQDAAGTTHAVETKPVPVRHSRVLLTARRFESIDSSQSPPLQKTEVTPSKGDTEVEIIPAPNATKPEGSTVETKPQSPTREDTENVVAESDKTYTDITAENKEEHADTPADTGHNEAKVSAAADAENPAAEIAAADGTVRESSESKGTAGVPGESLIKTEPAIATCLEDAGINISEPPAMPTSGKEAPLQGSVETSTDILAESLFKSPTQPAVETAADESHEKCPPEQKEMFEAAADVVLESLPEPTAVSNATPKEEDTMPKPSNEPADETFKAVLFQVESAEPSEQVLKTRTEKVVECETQFIDNPVVEQSSEPKSTADHELNIEDALDIVATSDAESVQDNTLYRAKRLTGALDVKPSTAEAVPTPVEDPEQPSSEESTLNQKCHDSNNSEVFQKPEAELKSTQSLNKFRSDKSTCSFCNQNIGGTVKLIFSEPMMSCHPECLKCGVCARALGDLLTPMFLQNKEIQCRGCFKTAVKI